MASEQYSLCWDNFHKNMSTGMNSMLENEDLVDVTLAVEGRYIKAHKMVLSLCSPYFKELFKTNPCKHPIVFMKDVSYVAMSDLMQFMYQGEVQVSHENLTTFIKTAEALQIKGLTGEGNGSAEDVEEVQPVETYKPVPKPKKPAPQPMTQMPPPKRQRLQAEVPQQSLQTPKTDILSVTPSSSKMEMVQFKMEPYDQSQVMSSVHEEGGEDTFCEDTGLEDTTVDEPEEYSMVEGGEEPQAGTSTEGVGEGQGIVYTYPGIKNPKMIVECNEYTVYMKEDKRTRWRCKWYFKTKCRSTLLTYGKVVQINHSHNHAQTVHGDAYKMFPSHRVYLKRKPDSFYSQHVRQQKVLQLQLDRIRSGGQEVSENYFG